MARRWRRLEEPRKGGMADFAFGVNAGAVAPQRSALYRHVVAVHMRQTCRSAAASACAPALAMALGFGKTKKFRYAGKLQPGVQSPRREVPEQIARPDYAADGRPKHTPRAVPWDIEVKSAAEIQGMREAARVARHVLDVAGKAVRPGITTDEIDRIVHEETLRLGAYPSPLNYSGFPKSVCTSINEVICHGIPDSTVLQDGDILNVDVTCYYKGFHGDLSEMFLVGDSVDEVGKQLVKVTYECLDMAIEGIRPGMPYSDIGGIIQDHAEKHGFSVVRDFCGHGIGSVFHTTPNILHYRNKDPNGTMQPGHIFTIEPMINEGKKDSMFWPDKWTATTTDGLRSAQFEHTLLMTENGAERLTARTEESQCFWWERKH
ncbi:Methionine aminopeptidase 1A [Porphyridium purpureum]|uniref:Methionine aminopeptidase n=1 Tax=Porphyridium purpureum TaxID=35688 RepID=A0A5J4YU95_PORPP|nr:Methionine aminopeptidase 1A [Porphyridium purpureum]|eukprot:POR5630..scf229_5